MKKTLILLGMVVALVILPFFINQWWRVRWLRR